MTAGRNSAFPLLMRCRKGGLLVFFLGSGSTLCVGFKGVELSLIQTLMTKLEGQCNTFLLEEKAETQCQNGTENVLVQMSLRGEITMVKSKIIVPQQL